MAGILTFLGRVTSMISLLKGVEQEGKDPLSKEPPIFSTGGRGWPASTSEDVNLNAWMMPLFLPPLGPSHSETGQVLRGSQVPIWALPANLAGEVTLSPELRVAGM